jgi:hypothetical protein
VLSLSIGGFAALTVLNLGILATLVILERAHAGTVAATSARLRPSRRQFRTDGEAAPR